MDFVQGIATQVKRFACDRCHSQKLRCPRPADGGEFTESCMRCQKAGASCNVSATLKTGRPSKALKLQARIDARSRVASPSSSPHSSSHSASTPPLQKETTRSDSKRRREETEESLHHAMSFGSIRTSSTTLATSRTSFPGLEATPTAMATDVFSDFLDFNMDFSDITDTCTSREHIGHEWDFTLHPSISNSEPNSADEVSLFQKNYTEQTDCTLSQMLGNLPRDQDMTLLEDSTMIEDFTYSAPFSTHITPAAIPSVPNVTEDSRQWEGIIQNTSQGPPEVTIKTRDTRPACLAPCRISPLQYKRSQSGWHTQSPCGSSTNLRLEHQGADTSRTDEFQCSQTLLQLQIEIYNSSAKFIDPCPTTDMSKPEVLECQDQSGALGRFFCAAENFIKLISETCVPINSSVPSTPNSRLSPRCRGHSNTAVTGINGSCSSLFNKRRLSSSTLGSFGQDMIDTTPPPKPRFLDTTAFHLVMACHTRLLMTYDIIINTIAEQLPNASSLDLKPCTPAGPSLSIGAFTIQSGTFLESLLHLQVISHQLDHLSDRLYRYLLLPRPLPHPDDLSSAPSPRTSYQSLWTATSATYANSATGLIEEQEMALKMNIARIRGLARESHML